MALSRESKFSQLNDWGRDNVPFVFLIDYSGQHIQAFRTDEIPEGFAMCFGEKSWGSMALMSAETPRIIKKTPMPYAQYLQAFEWVQAEMAAGNTYLLNLTFPTQIFLEGTLDAVFRASVAPYRFYMAEQGCCFSPECFVSIANNQIQAMPVKGTADIADDPTGQRLMENEKERAEHAMVVDLLRNDLALVATDVGVKRFRQLETVPTDRGVLWQTASTIVGTMPPRWPSAIGDILQQLMPPGSVTGMPKHETCKIIDRVELRSRGYYCGIFGYYENQELHSAVTIRYIMQRGNDFFYHSGGGITVDSNPQDEYAEMLRKIYLPVQRS